MPTLKPRTYRLTDESYERLVAMAKASGREPGVLIRELIENLGKVRPEDWRSADSLSLEGIETLRLELCKGG